MQSDFDNNLQSYFTDMEHLRGMFKEYVVAPSLPKRIIVIHGVGGSGKSSLLRMFRIQCKSVKIPVALASGDDTKSIFDVITRWMDDLKEDGVKFSSLSKTMETYRAIQAKVDDQAKKAQNAGGRMADIASKAASKTAETAGGALLGAAIGSIVPGIGTAIGGALGGVVSGMGAEALTDWLRGFLTKTDIDLLLDPAKRLTVDFLTDMAKAAEKNRIVLLLDTYEQMTVLEDWVGEVAQKIHPNILMAIAGRKLPDWNRAWQGWMASAQVEELKPMTEDIMRQLIHRYYATMRGGEPNPVQVETIIRFARGLPMAVTSAVQLWVKYGVEDFQSVKAEIVANLVDRLMEGVPSAFIPALEAAAIVRWFDQPILRATTGLDDVRDVYNELRRFPFVRTRSEGLALHDSVREMIDENLRVQDSERHSELHERAAVYFEKRMEKVQSDDAERLGLERLYHRVRADEFVGIKLFQEMAEELTRYKLVNRLRALLNDINAYPLQNKNSTLWVEYYNARLAHLETRLADAEKIYEMVAENKNAETKLQSYALCDWGWMLRRREVIHQPGGLEKAVRVLQSSLSFAVDSKTVLSWVYLSDVYTSIADWNNALSYIEKAKFFFDSHKDLSAYLIVIDQERGIFARQGNWRRVFDIQSEMQKICINAGNPPNLRIRTNVPWEWLWMGRYFEWQQDYAEVVNIAKERQDQEWITTKTRDFGLCIALQSQFSEVNQVIDDSLAYAESWGSKGEHHKFETLNVVGMTLLKCGNLENAIKTLSDAIEIGKRLKAHFHIAPVFLATAYEMLGRINQAKEFYQFSYLESKSINRNYVTCAALIGLIRISHTQSDFAIIQPLLAEAEQLAQQYEYNDHLASLRLVQGHLAWETDKKEESISFYQNAMIYALRYNRFLLDELLSGRPQGTPLHSIIPYCVEHDGEGKEILITLRDWWATGINDIETPRPDTISPIPEGISLLEAEKIARKREPGDGSMQKSVIEQIEAAL